MEVKRVTYGLLNVASEIGGFIKIAQVTVTIMIYPVAHYLYLLVIMRRLYMAKTKTSNFFSSKSECHHHNQMVSKYLDVNRIPIDLQVKEF